MNFGGGLAGDQSSPPIGEPGDELSTLKQQAEVMGEQMQQMQQRIRELEQEKKNG